jgi:hypothetical protein
MLPALSPVSERVFSESMWRIGVWPLRCGICRLVPLKGRKIYVPGSLSKKEQRKWARLDLAIPVFIRTRDGNGRDSLEFATAINISPGGALVVARRSLAKLALVSLEIPSAPIGPTKLKISPRIIRAKAVWVTHLDDHHLVGLKFSRALSTDAATVPGKYLRKASSAV